MMHTEAQGIEYLTALIQAQYDPDAAEPPLPVDTLIRGKGGPKTVQQLRRQMAHRLAEKVKSEFGPGTAGLFVLTKAQARTLGTLGLPPEISGQVLSLNWLREAPDNHAVNVRLKTIAALPATSEGETPGWKKWWLEHAHSRIGIYRPQDHDPLKDPVSEMLDQVVRAMARAAAPEIPNHGDMARRLLENGIPNALNHRLVTPAKGRLDLTLVWTMGARIRGLAWLMGITEEKHAARRPESPEALKAELQEQGIAVRQDMGTITGLEELRKTLREADVKDVYANARSGQWHDRKAKESYMLDHRGYRNGGENNQVRLREGENPDELRTWYERRLMTLTVPEHPGVEDEPIHSTDPAAANVGFLDRVSPKAVREYLDGRSEDPNPPQPAPCPRAAECPSWCGQLQEAGEFPFPLTHDGKYENCGYWQFLEKYGALEPSRRETFAKAAMDAELEGRKNNRKPEPAVTEEESLEEENSPEAKPEKTGQAALF